MTVEVLYYLHWNEGKLMHYEVGSQAINALKI